VAARSSASALQHLRHPQELLLSSLKLKATFAQLLALHSQFAVSFALQSSPL
jgi:hypothetical protein